MLFTVFNNEWARMNQKTCALSTACKEGEEMLWLEENNKREVRIWDDFGTSEHR